MEDAVDESERLASLTNLNPAAAAEEEEEEEEQEERGKNPGGLSNLSISIPSFSHQEEEEEEEVKKEGDQVEENMDDGGLINQIVSKLDAAINQGLSPREKKKREGEESSGGGVIHHLISTLPASLPISGDQAPEADEASLLISIIED